MIKMLCYFKPEERFFYQGKEHIMIAKNVPKSVSAFREVVCLQDGKVVMLPWHHHAELLEVKGDVPEADTFEWGKDHG